MTVARNLQEQVLKNKQDIEKILQAEKVLAEFGIKVQGRFDTYEELIAAYPPETYQGDFGDAYAIGRTLPYSYYVYSRGQIWFNIGEFPKAGPQGAQGVQGPQGPQGINGESLLSGDGSPSPSLGSEGQVYMNLVTGAIYKKINNLWTLKSNMKGPQGAQGVQGPQGVPGNDGVQGPQGPQGDVGGFINIQGHVDSSSQLPDPSTITNRTWAYLVGNTNDLYVQVPQAPGSTTYFWQNFGQLNVGTYCTVNGQFVNVFNLDNKVDKVSGKQLSDQNFTQAEKQKLATVAAYAQPVSRGAISINGGLVIPLAPGAERSIVGIDPSGNSQIQINIDPNSLELVGSTSPFTLRAKSSGSELKKVTLEVDDTDEFFILPADFDYTNFWMITNPRNSDGELTAFDGDRIYTYYCHTITLISPYDGHNLNVDFRVHESYQNFTDISQLKYSFEMDLYNWSSGDEAFASYTLGHLAYYQHRQTFSLYAPSEKNHYVDLYYIPSKKINLPIEL